MFEKEIKFIADFNLNKVKSYGSFITFEKLRGSSIHPAVIQYISAELDYLVSEDRRKLLQESVFDYSGAEAAKYFNLIAHEVKKNKKISFEDLKKLVIQAVSFNLNFLARPKWSLSKLIYNDEENKSIEEIKLNLNYIYFYDYIKSIFLSYISKRKLTNLSVTEFELIINKLDYELFGSQPQKLVDYSLYSIAEFFNLGEINKTKVPVAALELFLKEKNLMDFLFRLKKAVPENSNQKYEIEDIKKIIYSAVPVDVKQVESEEAESEEKEDDIILPAVEDYQPELPGIKPRSGGFSGTLADEEEGNSLSNKIAEQKDEEEPQKDLKEPEAAEPSFLETANEDKFDAAFFKEENIVSEAELPEAADEKLAPDPVESMSNEDFFSMFSDEVKKIEENDTDLKPETDEPKPETAKKDDADSFFDFEEETENLLKAFKDTVDEINSKDIDLLEDSSVADKAAMDLIKDFHDEGIDADNTSKEDNNSNPAPKAAKLSEKKGKNILDSISHNDIEKIISNVFNDDNEDFSSTIEKLNECTNYDEATEILKSVFVTYRVNPYTKDALTLTNTVANYFTQD
ncbi:MAG: hypothetical protein P4L45_11310 [Ignavibacteriaceae bacterium]|nr:hypothetical protein [Ignavibacteriaceae bacterium]